MPEIIIYICTDTKGVFLSAYQSEELASKSWRLSYSKTNDNVIFETDQSNWRWWNVYVVHMPTEQCEFTTIDRTFVGQIRSVVCFNSVEHL